MRKSLWTLVVILAALAHTGCSQLSQRADWAKWNWKAPTLGLPSPSATIEASEKRQPATSAKAASSEEEVAAALARGKSLEASQKSDKARSVYEAALQKHAESPELAHALGVLLDKQGRHADAEECLLLALKSQPRNPEFLGDLGYCYLLQGRLDSAEAALVKAATLQPNNARFHNNLGLVLGHQQRFDEAFSEFSKTGTEADAFYNMAFVFAAQDHVEEAKGCFQQALTVDPQYGPAREALASFEEFDRLTPEQQKASPMVAKSGVRYVPYIEGASTTAPQTGASPVQQASATSPVAMPSSRTAGRATRNLQNQSRGLLGGHMQSQRNAQTQANAAAMQAAP